MAEPTNSPTTRTNYLLPNEPRWPVDVGRPVIELRGVTKRFGDNEVLCGLDLAIETGKATVICGQSGSGKSVLLRMMNGLMLPDEGEVLLFGENTRQVSGRRLLQLRKRVTMMFQSYALMDSYTVTENIAFPLVENTKMPYAKITTMVQELLELLDLGDAGAKMPSELSGGMKKRVSLARAVISNPEVVLFDEPTTGLDPIMIEFVDSLIDQTQQLYGITSAIISHDMSSTLRLADKVAMLEEGVISEFGTVKEVINSGNPLVEVFFAGAGDRLTSVAKETVTSTATSVDSTETTVVSKGSNTPSDAKRRTVEQASNASDGAEAAKVGTPSWTGPAVEVIGLHKSFGSHHVLKGIDLTIPRGKITVVIGGSGSGKSVIMKHIIGIFRPDEGQVKVLGEDIAKLKDTELLKVRTRFGMLFQGAALLDALSVQQNVAFPLWERGHSRKVAMEKAYETLKQLRIEKIAGRFTEGISNGQKKRAGLARAIVTRPEIVIYDEPTTGQDPVMARYVDDMIVEAQELFNITSIIVSHDMIPTFRIGHQIAMLHLGEIRACGSPTELMGSADPYVRRFIYAGGEDGRRAQEEIDRLEGKVAGAQRTL